MHGVLESREKELESISPRMKTKRKKLNKTS
jgi:hypothetical protein